MNFEYNLLTKRLLDEGYTAKYHPEYVDISRSPSRDKGNPLDNFDGGFTYYYWYIAEKTYKTPCGMQCKGNFANAGLTWKGTEYCFENDCPWILCPKGENNCQLRDEPFKSEGDGVLCRHCAVHPVNEEYRYEGSCEEQLHLLDDEIRRKKISFSLEKNGRVCDNHMYYDIQKKEWIFNYNPFNCANGFCRAQSSDFKDGGWCPVMNKYISNEKGNVFYDVKYSGRDYSKDGTLFEGERFETIIKGRQLFNKPIRMEVAKMIANLCQDEIKWKVRWNTRDYDSLTFFRAERGEIDFNWEVLNIRAEKKRVRDLEQDLRDIEDGIKVVHDIDEEKQRKATKRENKEKRKEKQRQTILNKIANGKELSCSDKKQIGKLNITGKEIEAARDKAKEKNSYRQMELMDFI